MVDFSSEKYRICLVGSVKSQYLYIKDALVKGGLTDRFCLEKGPMDVGGGGGGGRRGVCSVRGFLSRKTSISEHTRLSRIRAMFLIIKSICESFVMLKFIGPSVESKYFLCAKELES